ncbi:MAG: C25 family cysteine peptidase [Bernardetiaceae bacterium]|jgi:hypothetical protein|nr:C25 family cysteine peptidase [Bernardetiaceae bacterium]
MKYRLLFLLVTVLQAALGQAQAPQPRFGNEWINYDQPYWKLVITPEQEGFHRISYQTLQAVGFPVATVNPRNIQIFNLGRELAINVVGEQDGRFDPTDYIEFFGKWNMDMATSMTVYEDQANGPSLDWCDHYRRDGYYFVTIAATPGKRIASVAARGGNDIPLETYHIQEHRSYSPIWGQYVARGPLYPTSFVDANDRGALLSHFVNGKGIAHRPVRPSPTIHNEAFNLVDVQRNAPVPAQITVRMVGRINMPHRVELLAGTSPDSQRVALDRVDFRNYDVADLQGEMRPTSLPNGNGPLLVGVRVNQVIGPAEDVSIGHKRVFYPQGFDMQGGAWRKFFLNVQTSRSQSRVQLRNVAAGTRLFDITNEAEIKLLQPEVSGNVLTALVEGTNNPGQKKRLLAESRLIDVTALTRINFRRLDVSNADYLIVTHPGLMRPAGDVPNAVQAYADYRASAAGGGYTPLVVDIFELCDQFTDGEPNPIAIRRFADWAIKRGRAKFLLLMGKGWMMERFYFLGDWTFNQVNVPPAGAPGSDNEHTNGLNGMPRFVPALATGRISALTPQQVIDYLNKVKEYEAPANAAAPWRKQALFLSGGVTANENALFRQYADQFANVARNNYWGANASILSKRTTETVEFLRVNEQINQGTNVVTFYGHAALDFTDIDIGRASDPSIGYNNRGKYPFMIVNGCGSGDAFTINTSLGEDWVLTANKGAIGFLAHSHLGLSGPLRAYTQTFFENAFGRKELIDKPIGVVLQETLRDYLSRFPGEVNIANAQQFILQADPAIRLFPKAQTDYAISATELFARNFQGGQNITAQADSFRIAIPVTNWGITDPTPLTVSVRRVFSDQSQEFLPVRTYAPINFRDTIYYTIVNPRNAQDRIAGLNTFEVTVDATNQIAELDEANNIASFTYNILRGSLLTIAPKDYSIVSRQPVFFVAQNSDPASGERRYRFQLDTSYRFNSPALKDTVVFGYITPQWTTNLLANTPAHDSTVYYWRARYADFTALDDTTWAEASFVYINNSPDGWSQSRAPQFRRNTTEGLGIDLTRRRWNFNSPVLNFDIRAVGANSPAWNTYQMVVNGNIIATAGSCATNRPSLFCDRRSTSDRLLVLLVDGQTGKFYKFEDMFPEFCGSDLMVMGIDQCWTFRTGIVADIINRMKTGDYIVMMNSRGVGVSNWGGLVGALNNVGIDGNRFLQMASQGPFVTIGRKGSAVGSAAVAYADPNQGNMSEQTIRLVHTVTIPPATNGIITSTLIGPAAEWGSTFRLVNGLEQPVNERWQLDVIGVNSQGQERVISANVPTDNFNLRQVNAREFPYLRLRLSTRDSARRTPAQLQRWQVVYREVPEGILLHDTVSYRENTTLDVIEGDTVRIGFNFLNISGNDFQDSLTVVYTIVNQQSGRTTTIREKIPPVRRNSFARVRTRLFSPDFRGENRLTVTVNPRLLPEQIYENNTLSARFRVKADDIRPLLDVAVDGRPLMDGDIVQPAPLIAITLRDENRYLPKRDTTGFEIMLGRQCPNCSARRIYLNDPNLTWNVTADQRFVIEYRSTTLQNGNWVLSVQATDATGNRAGTEPYRVTFRVINETTVTNFYPYPNPFSTSCRFVFTLTGQVPEQIRIQILTVTGRVVRTIHKDELGPLRVGNNITEFAWDGTDEYGQQLARGVYLYKVDVVDGRGEAYQSRETQADHLFKNGYGKLYLMR